MTSHRLDTLNATLLSAIMKGQLEVIIDIVQEAYSTLIITKLDFQTAVIFAARDGQLEILKYLVQDCQLGIDNYITNNEAIQHSTAYGQLNTTKLLLSTDYVVSNYRFDFTADLYRAIQTRCELSLEYLQILQYLIEESDVSVNPKTLINLATNLDFNVNNSAYPALDDLSQYIKCVAEVYTQLGTLAYTRLRTAIKCYLHSSDNEPSSQSLFQQIAQLPADLRHQLLQSNTGFEQILEYSKSQSTKPKKKLNTTLRL